MVIKSQKGYFEILKNVREAFDIDKFELLYIEEIYDHYEYLVLDIADLKMRIKGFNTSKGENVSFECIMDYVVESCNYLAPFAILKRVNEEYFLAHKDDPVCEQITKPLGEIETIEKENFDKSTIKFIHTTPNEKNIDLNNINISQIKLYDLPESIKEEIIKEKSKENKSNKKRFNKEKQTKVFSHKNS